MYRKESFPGSILQDKHHRQAPKLSKTPHDIPMLSLSFEIRTAPSCRGISENHILYKGTFTPENSLKKYFTLEKSISSSTALIFLETISQSLMVMPTMESIRTREPLLVLHGHSRSTNSNQALRRNADPSSGERHFSFAPSRRHFRFPRRDTKKEEWAPPTLLDNPPRPTISTKWSIGM
jgi:hypothetical protein